MMMVAACLVGLLEGINTTCISMGFPRKRMMLRVKKGQQYLVKIHLTTTVRCFRSMFADLVFLQEKV
jgi:hypothetical protein